MSGISRLSIANTPITVIDFETTGMTPGYDRVVEVAAVRIEPGRKPTLVFDSLINPERSVAATEIHGITDAHVANAPKFRDVAAELLEATRDSVIASYNVYFDLKFLIWEMSKSGVKHQPPHLCLMYMRPMLGLGGRCKLSEACHHHGIPLDAAHCASSDSLAAGHLWVKYLAQMQSMGVETFSQLKELKKYKFSDSFSLSPYPSASVFGLPRTAQRCSRSIVAVPVDPVRVAIAEYWDSLKTVLADLDVTDEEAAELMQERRASGLSKGQIRALHAKAFASVIAQFLSDQEIDDREALRLRRLKQCLSALGWAPGD